MGAWGTGPFENDTAMDFAGTVHAISDLEKAFELEHVECIDAATACEVIAAAECIAAMRGHALPDMPDDLARTVSKFGKPSMALFNTARDCVSAVIGRSELTELWAEADEEDRKAFNLAMTDLMERLSEPAKSARKPAKRKKEPIFNHSPCSFCGEPMGEIDASMFDITVSADDISSMRLGGWAHIKCLNAALHPSHLIQNWELDDELLEFVIAQTAAERGED